MRFARPTSVGLALDRFRRIRRLAFQCSNGAHPWKASLGVQKWRQTLPSSRTEDRYRCAVWECFRASRRCGCCAFPSRLTTRADLRAEVRRLFVVWLTSTAITRSSSPATATRSRTGRTCALNSHARYAVTMQFSMAKSCASARTESRGSIRCCSDARGRTSWCSICCG
jgi:hypothetical protein